MRKNTQHFSLIHNLNKFYLLFTIILRHSKDTFILEKSFILGKKCPIPSLKIMEKHFLFALMKNLIRTGEFWRSQSCVYNHNKILGYYTRKALVHLF